MGVTFGKVGVDMASFKVNFIQTFKIIYGHIGHTGHEATKIYLRHVVICEVVR